MEESGCLGRGRFRWMDGWMDGFTFGGGVAECSSFAK